jgi:hypothetical protein
MNLLLLAVLSAALSVPTPFSVPGFRQYPATEGLNSRVMLPRITDAPERKFHTVLSQAITKGYNVVEGGTENERRGPNFGGHYVLVQWGCGTSCMYGALIDANTGKVFRLPQIPGAEQTGFKIPTIDLRSLLFRTNSRLLGVENIGDSQTYYYVLVHGQWRFLKKLPTPES